MKIGLALSGGVARGAAHLGVLSVLEEENIPIHCIAGTSAGSIIGAAYCAGMTVDDILTFSRIMNWRKLVRPTLSRRGFLSFAPLERTVNGIMGEIEFSDLKRPFAAVATDMQTGAPYIFEEGPVARAIHASSAIPGVVVPVVVNGRVLSDGGLSDNLPVQKARDLGAEYVIGVDLLQPSEKKGNIIQFSIAAAEIMVRQSGGGFKEADCLIIPELAGRSYVRFSKADEFFALGQQAARAAMPEIREAIAA